MTLHICSDYIWNNLYYELISRLQKDKINNIVYVPICTNRKYVDKNKNEDYKVIKSSIYNEIDRYFFYRKERKILEDIHKIINFENIKIIHAHTLFSAGYIAYKIKEKYNIDYVVSVRNTDVNTFFKYRKNLKKVGINILKNASKIIFISENHKKILFKKYIPKKIKEQLLEKSVVLYNGIDKFWLQNENKHHREIKEKSINLLQIGRLDKNKNFETTIKVYRKLKKEGFSIKLNIVGQGKNEAKLKKMAKNDSNIIFHGQISKEKLIDLYRGSDIFILPSKYETFGLVYAEALTQSIPIIYTRGQGFDGIFKEGEVGYSVKYNSINEIIENIKKISCNYESITKRAYNCAKIFDWDVIEKEYKKIYDDLQIY